MIQRKSKHTIVIKPGFHVSVLNWTRRMVWQADDLFLIMTYIVIMHVLASFRKLHEKFTRMLTTGMVDVH